MHYKNGREAKVGDHVIAKDSYTGQVVGGVLHSLNASATTCNALMAVIIPGTVIQQNMTVGDLVHVEDALATMPAVPPAPAS